MDDDDELGELRMEVAAEVFLVQPAENSEKRGGDAKDDGEDGKDYRKISSDRKTGVADGEPPD